MSGLTQWAIVAVIVVLCAAYAVKVLLPRGARLGLAKRLRARGYTGAAAQFEGGSGCDACANNATRPSTTPRES